MAFSERFDNVDAAKLARLLDVDSLGELPAKTPWREDPAAILRHQLAAPLLPDLLIVPGAEAARLRTLLSEGARTFGEELTLISPRMDVLEAIKHFARHVKADAANPLCGPAADVLYFAAIAAALARCHRRITSLDDAALLKAFAWARIQVGAENLVALFKDAEATRNP